jgi:hypothetical protein
MAHIIRRLLQGELLLGALLLGAISTSPAQAQNSPLEPRFAADSRSMVHFPEMKDGDEVIQELMPPGDSTPAEDSLAPPMLKSLPRPPEQPGSLFDPAPPIGAPPRNWEQPYFERDPVLDPRRWPQPGWFAAADVGLIKPHVSDSLGFPVVTGLGHAIVVQLGSARLDWTAAPRLEVGYRLPSGFGEISLSDRYFTAVGSGAFAGPDGRATRSTRFMVNYTDLDYASREYTPFVNWTMKWRVGFRSAETFLRTRVDESLAAAAAGGGFFSQQATNRSVGFGPHFGLELERRLRRPGLAIVTNVDGASLFTTIHQQFTATNLAVLSPGRFDSGTSLAQFKQDVPVLIVQLGLSWQPVRRPNSRLYLGYMGQFWYQFATDSNNRSGPFGRATPTQFDTEGIVFQWSRNY